MYGALAWFLGVWVVMMAAMMLPPVSPTVALYSRMTKARSPVAPLLFTSGYLVTWAGVGGLAFAVAGAGGRIGGDVFAWDRAGRWVAGVTLVVAAVYELTPLKDVCLGQCRSPLDFLLGSWRAAATRGQRDQQHEECAGRADHWRDPTRRPRELPARALSESRPGRPPNPRPQGRGKNEDANTDPAALAVFGASSMPPVWTAPIAEAVPTHERENGRWGRPL